MPKDPITGIGITPWKGGRTKHLHIQTTPEVRDKLDKMRGKISIADFLSAAVDLIWEDAEFLKAVIEKSKEYGNG